MAKLPISQSVGDVQPDGSPSPNLVDDVLVVQHLLNQSHGPGNPLTLLPLNGVVSPEFIAAIRAYEGPRGPVDGRIDPDDATMVSLNAVALSEFEGITDPLERRSIIFRPLREWNFTRGDYKTLTEMAGLSLRFDPACIWLPDVLKVRMLKLLNKVLSINEHPAATWGINIDDAYHFHLALWSGIENERVSLLTYLWNDIESTDSRDDLRDLRNEFGPPWGVVPIENVASYQAAYATWVASPQVASMLNKYAELEEGVIVLHTFENPSLRPPMESDDPRRHWMVDVNGQIETPPYRTNEKNLAASRNGDFILEGPIAVNFLIDKLGVIRPVLGSWQELAVVTGLPSALFRPFQDLPPLP
jgi:hypothetical protein